MRATFDNGIELVMTKDEARCCTHPGPCDEDVRRVSELPKIRRQLAKLSDDAIRAALKPYGAWDEDEMQDRAVSEHRLVWLAAGSIVDDITEA